MIEILVALITILGPIIGIIITKNKGEDRQLVIYDKLNKALQNDTSTKLEVTELFRLATGIRMKYSDIKKLVDDENCSWLIHMLKMTPGYVRYENGKLHYNKMFSKPWIRKAHKYIENTSVYIGFILYVLFALCFVFLSSIEWKIFSVVILIASAYLWISSLKSSWYLDKVDELIVYDLPDK